MTAVRYAVRALALSLSLTAAGALCVVDPASPAQAAVSSTVSGNVGGPQLGGRGILVNLKPGVPAPPAMPGASYVIADMKTGQILAAKGPHTRRRPASTLKALTALTLIPVLDPKTKILVKPADANAEGSHLGIVPGSSYTVESLMQGLLMVSGNDAAYALARGNQSVTVTLKAMNTTAAELGALDTVAKDPSGLDKAGQTSSAYDLALIGRAAMKLPDFRRYVSTKRATMPGGRSTDGKLKPAIKMVSHNRLLYNYRGAIGIKTGYTNAARHTYIGAATRGGKTYIVTQMASPSGSWRPTAALLDWAFTHGSSLTPIGKLVEPGTETNPVTTSAAGEAPGKPLAQAATRPREEAHPPALPPWAGVAGLISAMALVGGWAARNISRRR